MLILENSWKNLSFDFLSFIVYMDYENQGEKYHVHQPHDKIFKTVLNEKNQIVELINDYTKEE